MRKALIIGGVLAAVVLLAGAALLLLIDVNQFRPQIEAQLQKRVDRPVALGEISLKLFPLSIGVQNFTIGEDPSLGSPRPFVHAKEIHIRAELGALLRKQLEINSLILREPAIELIKSRRGSWNFASIGGKSPAGGGQRVALDRIEVIDGVLALTDEQAGEPRTVYEDIDIVAAMPKEALTADVSLNAFGGQINATLAVSQAGTPAAALSGSGKLSNLSLPVSTLTKPLVLRTASFALDSDELKMTDLVSSLGSSTLKGSASVKNFSAPALRFNAAIDQLDVLELQKLMAPAKGAGASRQSGGLSKISGNGTLNIGALQYSGLSMKNVKASCTLDRGVIQLTPVESELSGGHQIGSITVDTRPQYPTFAVKTKLQKVDANELLSAATSLKGIIHGLLAGEAETRFVSRPGEDIARSLNGEVRLELANGKIEGANLLNEMAVLGKFLGAVKRSEAFTTVAGLTGSFLIKDGIANTNDLRLDFGGGIASVTGTVNLVDQSLDLRMNTVFGKELSERAGGTQVGGLMTTTLANSKGELVIPAIISGTFAKPRFTPDVKRFAEMKLRNLLPASDDSSGAKPSPVESLIDLFRRKKKTP